jgi:hypothetical protein
LAVVTFDPLIASIDRAGDHGIVVGMLVMIALAGALVYGLYLLVKGRADRPQSDEGRGDPPGPKA